MRWMAIVFQAVMVCIVYGIAHDQITARICVEYFTIGHAPIFDTDDPTLLAIGWGVLATWWVGVFLGIPLATAARVGNRPKLAANHLLRPMGILFIGNALVATSAGISGYLLAKRDLVQLPKGLADKLPPETHVAFLTDLWIHNGSYIGGFFLGLTLIVWTWRKRQLLETKKGKGAILFGTKFAH